jgi:TonB family protein
MRPSLPVLVFALAFPCGVAVSQQSLSDYAKAHPLRSGKGGGMTIAGGQVALPTPTTLRPSTAQDLPDLCLARTRAELQQLRDRRKTAAPEKPTGSVTAPVELSTVAPTFPESVRRRGVEGRVVVEAIISCEGRVLDPAVLSSTETALEASALEAVLQWRYRPAQFNGQPVPVSLSVAVKFALKKPHH